VLHEFADDLLVIGVGADGAREERPLAELLPHPFDRKDLA
jgi:cytidine deaminase